MPLHWEDQKAYEELVIPTGKNRGWFRGLQRNSTIENLNRFFEETHRFGDALGKLQQINFGDNPNEPNPESIKEAHHQTLDLVFSGESLLAHSKRLAESQWAEDFISEKDILEHLDRYAQEGRISYEIDDLLKAAMKLWQGLYEVVLSDGKFLRVDLPDALEADFTLAKNLFSVGFEDVAVLIAGRGLEGVLREIAHKKQLRFGGTGNEKPVWEADFRDIIEVLYRARWKKRGARLIDQPTKALLDYIRSIRNSHAHPNSISDESNYREQASLIASKANSLWKKATDKDAKLVSRKIKKDW
jgi:hypothetical protein